MTDRAEIERLLNQTGRTMEELQTEDQMFNDPEYPEKIDEYFKARHAVSYDWPHTFGLYQSQIIELLVGALRDALSERDAAIRDIPRACGYCKNYNDQPKIEESKHGTLVTYCEKECHNISGINTGWGWRGAK